MSRLPTLTPEELKALNAASLAPPPPSMKWFYIRAGFCIAFVTANALSLSIYFESVFGKFDLPPRMSEILFSYVAIRLAVAVTLIPIYFLSLYKRFYFVTLSILYIITLLINVTSDFLLIYTYVRPEATSSVVVMVSLRLIAILFIAINTHFYVTKLSRK